jgi:BolA protein
MQPIERIALMKQRLQNAFSPSQLDVIDDSEKHRGHAGSRDGAGHYTVMIKADSLQNKSRIEVHRQIYQVLADMMPTEIHALQIKIL